MNPERHSTDARGTALTPRVRLLRTSDPYLAVRHRPYGSCVGVASSKLRKRLAEGLNRRAKILGNDLPCLLSFDVVGEICP